MTKENIGIQPLYDRVVIRPRGQETTTAGGIVIPDTADKDKPMEGEVVAVGSGKYNDGKLSPLQVKVKDKVLFSKYSGTSVKLGSAKEEYLVMREEDILGILA